MVTETHVSNFSPVFQESLHDVYIRHEVAEQKRPWRIYTSRRIKRVNKHFAETVETLNIFELPSNNTDLLNDQLTAIIINFQNHPSIMKLKSKYNFQENFSFKQVPVKYVGNIIKNISNKEASGGEIPYIFLLAKC